MNVIKSQVQDTEHAINEMLQGSSGLEHLCIHVVLYIFIFTPLFVCWSILNYLYNAGCCRIFAHGYIALLYYYNFILYQDQIIQFYRHILMLIHTIILLH